MLTSSKLSVVVPTGDEGEARDGLLMMTSDDRRRRVLSRV
jgi:hypothetical protein